MGIYIGKKIEEIGDTSFKNIDNKLRKLNDLDRKDLEKDISIEELKEIVNSSKNNKSPGPDGFTNEFFKTFWTSLKMILLKLLNTYRHKKKLNKSQLEGTITCIPKGGKSRNLLKNWRPITLLNSIYKFFSSIIANRIKRILPKLIHPDQKGFINNRFIGENTRLTYDIINECNNQKQRGLILLIDFEKAFDSISWEFITKTLTFFNFGEDTINWVKSLQEGSSSKILQNGNFSDIITLGRGCRQGDPVSPYLFVLAAEVLSEAIRLNKDIEGITVFEKEHKVSQYADDTTLFIKPTEKSIRACMVTLKEFEQISGLKVNKEKTKVIKIGGWGDNRTILCKDLKLEWTQEFVSLGITYNIDKFDDITDLNINLKKIEIQKLIAIWNARFLTPFGKITVVKSLLISKIIHVLLSLPSPSDDLYEDLENLFKNFIWGNKPPKFRREILETLPNLGGRKLTNLRVFDHALKLSWLKRIAILEEGWVEFPEKYGIKKILKYGDEYPHKIVKKIKNKFWKDMLEACILLYKNIKYKNALQIHSMPLWYSHNINLEYKKEWDSKGYHNLGDILNNNGDLFTQAEFLSRGLKIHFIDYIKIKKNIKILQELCEGEFLKMGPHLPRVLFEIGIVGKGCNRSYNKLMDYNQNILIQVKNKWEETLNEEIKIDTVEKSFNQIPKFEEGAYFKYFQFKLLHNRTVTNVKLHKMKLADNTTCKICQSEPETIKHTFLDCPMVVTLWKHIERWLQNNVEAGIKLDDIDKIFGRNVSETIINKTILCAKIVIYNNRKTGKIHHINEVKRSLYYHLRCVEYHAVLNQREKDFYKIWGRVYNDLKDIYAKKWH